jgi:drug/metabolite transporter (DMT)-like permease
VSTFPLVLIIFSCFLHAGWNVLGRKHRSEVIQFFFRMNICISIAGFIPAAVAQWYWGLLGPREFVYCFLSGVTMSSFYVFLGKGYQAADLATVYPIARALPILMLMVPDAFRGEYPSPLSLPGIVLVSVGCLMAPMVTRNDFRFGTYFNRATVWLVMVGLATTVYSTFDKLAAITQHTKMITDATNPGANLGLQYALVYEYYQFLACTLGFTVAMRLFFRDLTPSPKMGWFQPFIAVCCDFGSYGLVMWVYQMVGQTSIIFAFRQFGVVLGIVIAFIVFKEPGKVIRTIASAVIIAGLFIVAWSKQYCSNTETINPAVQIAPNEKK